MRAAIWLAAGVLVGALGVAVALAAVPALRAPGAVAASDAPTVATSTATVVRETLQVTDELDGALGYGEEQPLLGRLAGTWTRLPDEGDILERGDTIAEVDGERVATLLYGARPAWRRLAKGVPNGADVKQLEENLKALGYAPKGLEVDRRFDADTRIAIERWQRAQEVEDDGVVELGEVVFLPGPLRVASVTAQLGAQAQPGTTIATTTGVERVVSIDLEADERGTITAGDSVEVELPDGTMTSGTVSEVGTLAQASADGGEATLDVTVTLDDPQSAAAFDGADVTVHVVRTSREDVLAVPVDALLALREGGYAVEVADGDGSTHLEGVETGLFDDGLVEVRGALEAGDSVVVPR